MPFWLTHSDGPVHNIKALNAGAQNSQNQSVKPPGCVSDDTCAHKVKRLCHEAEGQHQLCILVSEADSTLVMKRRAPGRMLSCGLSDMHTQLCAPA